MMESVHTMRKSARGQRRAVSSLLSCSLRRRSSSGDVLVSVPGGQLLVDRSQAMVLRKNTLHQLLSLRSLKELLCARCGKTIVPGDLVHRTSAYRYYHQSCWDSLQMDL